MSATVLRQLNMAAAVVGELTRYGHLVLQVNIDGFANRPTVEIAKTKLCEGLRGVPTREVDEAGNVTQLTVVRLGGCRVQWRQ